jgi:hypothetical protein
MPSQDIRITKDTRFKITVTEKGTALRGMFGIMAAQKPYDREVVDFELLKNVMLIAQFDRFSTDRPTPTTRFSTGISPHGASTTMNIHTLDGRRVTPEFLVALGDFAGIHFKENPYLDDHRKKVADRAYQKDSPL